MQIPGFASYKERHGITSRSVIEPGLERMERVLDKLGHPERFSKVIHVAGTNGKGSTIAFIKALCEAHSISYGAFQSPAIVDVHDQIVVDGQAITSEELDAVMMKIAQVPEAKELTDFELLTICAFVHFQYKAPEVWIIETGMGGRFDSTNVIPKSVAVITSLSLDHTNFLGTTLDSIGYHKAGIIKPHSNVFVPSSIYLPPIKQQVNEVQATLHSLEPFGPQVELSLLGEHQRMNATLAVHALESLFDLDPKKVELGLKKAYIPFRMEKIADNVYLDGAHNEASARSLVETVQQQFVGESIHIVMGILGDKDYETVLRLFEQVADRFTFVEFSHERALEPNRLVELCHINEFSVTDVQNLDINTLKNEKFKTFVTGSLYFLSEWRFKNSI